LRPRLLVVDPDGILQRLVGRYLEAVEVAPAADLAEAAQILARTPAQALLVNAPSPAEALDALANMPGLADRMPVVVCSVPGPHQAAASLGVADYLVKPIARADLLAALERLNLAGRTLLVADDDPELLQLFRRMLASAGPDYRVLRAGDGREALDLLRSERPDAVLVDLSMPVLDGFGFLAEKARDPSLRDIPAVVISARDPLGQPVVSNALTITRHGGLSAHELLACVENVVALFGAGAQRAPDGSAGR
jgi:CheY-like chemotaxis protein